VVHNPIRTAMIKNIKPAEHTAARLIIHHHRTVAGAIKLKEIAIRR